MAPEERQQFAKKIMTPLESIAKHLTDHSAIEESKFEESQSSEGTSLPLTRYQELDLDEKNEKNGDIVLDNDSEAYLDLDNNDDNIKKDTTISPNDQLIIDDDYASTEKYETDGHNIMVTTEKDYDSTTVIDSPP